MSFPWWLIAIRKNLEEHFCAAPFQYVELSATNPCSALAYFGTITDTMIEKDFPMILKDCPLRVPIRLTSVPLPRQNVLRMQELGVRVGAEAVIMQKAAFGGLIVNIAGSRIAVDHKWAKRIEAQIVE